MRTLLLSLPLLLSSGCSRATAAAWVPTVIVRGGLAQARDLGAGSTRAGRDWRVSVDARWRLARADGQSADPPIATRPAEAPGRLPCVDPALCAWERRSRTDTLARIERWSER